MMNRTEQNETQLPRWHQELDVFSSVKSALILEGNVLDNYEFPYGCAKTIWMDLPNYLYYYFAEKGYKNIVRYNSIDGFTALGLNMQEDERKEKLSLFAQLFQDGEKQINGDHIPARFVSQPGSRGTAPYVIRDVLSQHDEPTVIVWELASRNTIAPDRIDPSALESYTIVLQGILRENDMSSCTPKRNLVVFIVNKQNDLPAWMYLGNSQIKSIMIDYPDASERLEFIGGYEPKDFIHSDHYKEDLKAYIDHENELHKIIDRFVARTDGFTYLELKQLRDLCQERKIHLKDLCSVIDLYIYGMVENPWRGDALRERLIREEKEKTITERVKGQDHIINECLDVLKRAVTGLSHWRNESSPKGILFFAGPTGTGKTETAKALASLVFGDESACIRFDMSEYQQEHSDQRLLGAPPGYVGYEAGGQLTNAVRRKPFSILLFDEIEKASPKIMDKFLQILEDGRMTDGQGNTAYFSDSIIIFTSNLGIYEENQFGERKLLVKRDQPKEEVRSIVKSAIENHFKRKLGRPEILNRIGENIFVFDFISDEVAEMILDARLKKIHSSIMDWNGIDIDFSEIREQLLERVKKNLDNGGRGINNVVEKELINPLARHIFDEHVQEGEKRIITKILDQSAPVDIEWRKDE